MIVIVSSERECSAYSALCESRGWVCTECGSLRAFRKLIRHTRVSALVVRHRLTDGYSDDAIAILCEAGQLPPTKIVVLIPATSSSAVEARQIKIGADCVLRDPVRTEVLVEHLDKYRELAVHAPRPAVPRNTTASFRFAGAEVHPADRELRHRGKAVRVSPREIELMETLTASADRVVSYHNFYAEIFDQRFRNDTSNLRVLLGLLDRSTRKLGISLRRWVEVIPKIGYRYRPTAAPADPRPKKKKRRKDPTAG